MKKQVKTLIIDLDNTIFDWFEFWYASFNPVYEAIKTDLALPGGELEREIRSVHQKRRTSEYPFLLEELKLLSDKHGTTDIREKFKAAIDEAAIGRDAKLKLYPTVFEALWRIKSKGTKIIAYTESLGFYSSYRVKRFGLDGVIDTLYCPEDHELPDGIDERKIRRHPDSFYRLEVTHIKHTPIGELKPNAKVLLDILKMEHAQHESTAYVGDGLYKDVLMAQNANVFDIFAKYGVSQADKRYELLQAVSHWTDDDIERERIIVDSNETITASIVLENSFDEIFEHCDFVSCVDCDLNLVLRTWEKTVEVQQHFNDMGMRIRSFAITLLGVMLTATGLIFSKDLRISLPSYSISASVVVLISALFFWLMFYFMDKYWYHVLLRGASEHAAKIEKLYSGKIPSISLSEKIFEASQNVRFLGFSLDSTARLRTFYGIGSTGIVILIVALFISTTSPQRPHNAADQTQSSLHDTTKNVVIADGE